VGTILIALLPLFILAALIYSLWRLVKRQGAETVMYCTACGHVGKPRAGMKGAFLVELFLWFLFILPGLLYSIWRLSTKQKVCMLCGSAAIIPADSPNARAALGARGEMPAERLRVEHQRGYVAYWMGHHWVWTLVLAVSVTGYLAYALRQSKPQAPAGKASPAGGHPAPSAAQQASNQRQDAIDKSALIGAMKLRASMRNPGSFTLVQVLTMDDGAVCYTYRAQNGFGGMGLGSAALSPSGLLMTNEISGFRRLWNKECARKNGEDRTFLVKYNLRVLRGIP
jgi:hypothetical protein